MPRAQQPQGITDLEVFIQGLLDPSKSANRTQPREQPGSNRSEGWAVKPGLVQQHEPKRTPGAMPGPHVPQVRLGAW